MNRKLPTLNRAHAVFSYFSPRPLPQLSLQRTFVFFVKKSASQWRIGHCSYLIYTPMPNLAVMRDLVEGNLCLSTFT